MRPQRDPMERASMKIPVHRLTDTPTPFVFHGDSVWWRSNLQPGRGLSQDLAESFRFEVRAHCLNQDILLEGSFSGALDLECSRCLKRYRHGLREPYRVVLERAGDRRPSDPVGAKALARDGMCLGDELETGMYLGNEINLGAFAVELVALALPLKPLCGEDCAGLCPQCGADRAVARCDCSGGLKDSPFAALAALRDGPEGGKI